MEFFHESIAWPILGLIGAFLLLGYAALTGLDIGTKVQPTTALYLKAFSSFVFGAFLLFYSGFTLAMIIIAFIFEQHAKHG